MSRSIHATLRNPRDPGDLHRKRRIKSVIVAERSKPTAAAPRVPPDAVPIIVRDRGRFVHFPASASDLRAVLALLPEGTASGIAKIELCIDESADDEGAALDPLVGRVSREIAPGIFSSFVLGTYHHDGSAIQLFPYVYDPATPHRAIVETYLRLTMLATFVHELGHHHDLSARVARGRWRGDDSDERESYAEEIEHAWTRAYVIPYLEETYPAEVLALQQWLTQYGGLALPLDVLAGDPRTTRGKGGAQLFFGVDSAFLRLLTDVMEGNKPPDTQVAFARQLHYGEHYDEALAILAAVVDAHADHAQALVLRADIFVHQGRIAEADTIVRALLLRNEGGAEAWEILGDIARTQGNWAEVLEATSRIGALIADEHPWRQCSNLELQVRARIELLDWEGAERALGRMRTLGSGTAREQRIEGLRCLSHLRQHHYEDALAAAVAVLTNNTSPPADVLAARFEAARCLGRPSEGGELAAETRDRLRRMGYAAWVVRLDALAEIS